MEIYKGNNQRPPVKCYCLIGIMVCFIATGLYFLIQSQIDPQSQQFLVLDMELLSWNTTLKILNSSEATIYIEPNTTIPLSHNNTDNWGAGIENFPIYFPLYFSNYSSLVTNATKTNIVYGESYREYNVTVDLKLEIVNNEIKKENYLYGVIIHSRHSDSSNAKVCRMNARGYWDLKAQSCYCHYNTEKICIVINDSLHVVDWYKSGCNGKGYYKQQIVPWTSDKPYEDFTQPILIEVRGESDPFVYASYNNLIEFSPSSKEYEIIGGTILALSTAILIIPGVWLYCRRKRLDIPEILSDRPYKDTI